MLRLTAGVLFGSQLIILAQTDLWHGALTAGCLLLTTAICYAINLININNKSISSLATRLEKVETAHANCQAETSKLRLQNTEQEIRLKWAAFEIRRLKNWRQSLCDGSSTVKL